MAKKVADPNAARDSSAENSHSGNAAQNSSTASSAIPVPDPQLAAQGQDLYAQFLAEQITSNNLELPPAVANYNSTNNLSETFSWESARNLRHLANEFSNSPLREAIRQRVQQIDLSSLNSENFMQMLQEVFSGGEITRERVLVVFFFCSDLTLRAIQQRASSCVRQVLQWSNEYISGGMALWVQQQGGWGALLNNSANTALKFSISAACCVAVLAMVVYIRKNWS